MQKDSVHLAGGKPESAVASPLTGSEPDERVALYRAAIGDRHYITADQVVLYRDENKPGNALSQLADRLEAARATSWICVKDRPPEYDQPVLIAWDCTPWSKGPEVFNELYAISDQGDCWLWYDFESGDLCEWGAEDCPTHWMPKPLPPVAIAKVKSGINSNSPQAT